MRNLVPARIRILSVIRGRSMSAGGEVVLPDLPIPGFSVDPEPSSGFVNLTFTPSNTGGAADEYDWAYYSTDVLPSGGYTAFPNGQDTSPSPSGLSFTDFIGGGFDPAFGVGPADHIHVRLTLTNAAGSAFFIGVISRILD